MSEREHKKILVVDENDNNPKAVTYDDAVSNGWIRRASRVFVINNSGEVLIQRRSKNISKPLLLDNSAAGHVDEGEGYIEAAIRETFEEIGIKAKAEDLNLVHESYRETNFFSNIYTLKVSDGVEIVIDEWETAEYLWMNPDELTQSITDNPDQYSPSLIKVWGDLRDKILST